MINPIWKTIITGKGVEYSVRLVFDDSGRLTVESNCDCRYGSFHRFQGKNKLNKWMCRHMVKAFAEQIKVSPMRAREVLVRQKIIHPDHLIKI